MLTLYIADVERDAGMKNLSRKEALEILSGMKVKIKIPKAAVMQNKRNAALDMAVEALKCSEILSAETGKNNCDETNGGCISKRAVAELLNDWLLCLNENCHKQSASDLKMIINDFKNLPSVQPERWIPVAEKSPLPQTPVWTTDIDGDVSVCKLSHSGNEWYGENDGRIYLRGSVVAWMPYNAPEPYQESSGKVVTNKK